MSNEIESVLAALDAQAVSLNGMRVLVAGTKNAEVIAEELRKRGWTFTEPKRTLVPRAPEVATYAGVVRAADHDDGHEVEGFSGRTWKVVTNSFGTKVWERVTKS